MTVIYRDVLSDDGFKMSSVEAVYVRFGRELRRVRRDKGLTQAELATRVGLGRTSIVNIEAGLQRIHLHTLVELARALEVSPATLLPDEPEEIAALAPQVATLPTAERDWVMRVVASGSAPRKRS
jgi:transcriptional regulator with XRE-family HTH domain